MKKNFENIFQSRWIILHFLHERTFMDCHLNSKDLIRWCANLYRRNATAPTNGRWRVEKYILLSHNSTTPRCNFCPCRLINLWTTSSLKRRWSERLLPIGYIQCVRFTCFKAPWSNTFRDPYNQNHLPYLTKLARLSRIRFTYLVSKLYGLPQ